MKSMKKRTPISRPFHSATGNPAQRAQAPAVGLPVASAALPSVQTVEDVVAYWKELERTTPRADKSGAHWLKFGSAVEALMVSTADSYGQNLTERVAAGTGLAASTVYAARQVSRIYTAQDREELGTLSYSHFKLFASMDNRNERMALARRALVDRLSIAVLRPLVKVVNAKKRQWIGIGADQKVSAAK